MISILPEDRTYAEQGAERKALYVRSWAPLPKKGLTWQRRLRIQTPPHTNSLVANHLVIAMRTPHRLVRIWRLCRLADWAIARTVLSRILLMIKNRSWGRCPIPTRVSSEGTH
jgi:hypothetical protein